MWTHFWDMHSGGRQKLAWGHIYIEADEKTAKSVFYARFDRNPDRVTCTCCGGDYNVDEYATLQEATAYQRGCAWDKETGNYAEHVGPETYARKYMTLEDYEALGRATDDNDNDDDPIAGRVLIIRKDEITPEQKLRDVPQQGYVWMGD